MTREEIIDLLTFARVYDARVTIGKAETAAWFLAIGRIPLDVAAAAVTAHYTAPIEPGAAYPRIAPGHVMAVYRAGNRPDSAPVPALTAAKASPEYAARCRQQVQRTIEEASARWELQQDPDQGIPRWRPGMDKQALALAQAEAARRLRMADA